MNLLDNEINKRLISGFFPVDKLYPDDDYAPKACDFEKLAGDGLKVFRQYPVILNGLFSTFEKRVKELESLKQPELFEQEANVLINTGYCVDDLNATGQLYLEAAKLCSAVTSVDKILWYGAWAYYFNNDIMPDDEHYREHRDMMFAWIYLLKVVQEKELRYGQAINVKSITSKTNILKLIESDWNKLDQKCFSKLTDYGMKRLKEVFRLLDDLSERIKKDNASQKIVADQTDSEWKMFIKLLNDLSRKENDVICQINRAGSPKDKARIINGYNSVLRGIERANYTIDGEEINLLSLFEAVNERMQNAQVYCVVKTEEGEHFRLNPAGFLLAMDPKTYNYLFMTFHEFRINPGKDTAKKFVSLALSAIKKNLGEEFHQDSSIDEMIKDFHQTVMDFVKKHAEAIERLSFEKLRKDSAIVLPELSSYADGNGEIEDLVKRLKAIEQSDEYDREIEKMIAGTGRSLAPNEVAYMVQSEAEREERIEQEMLASRIIASLNIIYMFSDALRIMLTNRHANVKIKNRDAVETYRRELLKLDDRLVHKVYASLGDQEIGMLEYREKNGIIATSLTEQETEEENYRNTVFGDILKNSISALIDSVEGQNAEQVLLTKARIREEILRYPECDEKERYTQWLDDISKRISDALVANCQREDNYQQIKEGILSSLGEKAGILPESTLDSLTTAEMLYARYASDEYAEKGFDFSCISALYYQAFEEAYNILIWRGYADELNTLVINGQKYTDILDACRGSGINPPDARGYLDQNAKQRSYYVEYSNASRPDTTVSLRCMYKSFAILLQNIKLSSHLEHFCDYIAKITGFVSRNDMFNDSDFMRNCNAFISAVDASADNRNNASHGGTFISITQCRSDKKTVLSELETVRSDSFGLIQQLLFLLGKR